jgi:hypothetical protein
MFYRLKSTTRQKPGQKTPSEGPETEEGKGEGKGDWVIWEHAERQVEAIGNLGRTVYGEYTREC